MSQNKRTRKIPTIFRTYFSPHRMNRLIRNIYLVSPDPASLVRGWKKGWDRITLPLLKFLSKGSRSTRKVAIVDLTILRDLLAVKLREPHKKMITISGRTRAECENIDLKKMLDQQALLLRKLLSEQKAELSRQSEKIIQTEKKRINEKIKSGSYNE